MWKGGSGNHRNGKVRAAAGSRPSDWGTRGQISANLETKILADVPSELRVQE